MSIKKKTHQIIEWFGWYGVLAILGAYGLLSFGFIVSDHPVYQLLNLTGAVALSIDAWVDRDYQPVVLNIIWMLIAFISLLRLFL